MNIQILQKFFNNEFYNEHASAVSLEDLQDLPETYSMWQTIASHHEELGEDLPGEMFMEIWRGNNQNSTNAFRSNVAILVDNVVAVKGISDKLAESMLQKEAQARMLRGIADMALRSADGDVSVDLNSIPLMLQNHMSDAPATNYKEVECNIADFLFKSSAAGLYKFRMPGLSDKIPGAGPGNFIIYFARPDMGKTTNCVYEAAGYALSGLKVAYFANEEPAHRVYLRLICSFLEQTQTEIEDDIEAAQRAFSAIVENITVLDCVGMSITEVDAWCAKHKPDVVFLDQLDKFSIAGNFSRGDEKLGDLYTFTREIAKRNSCLVWGITQCSAEGEGLARITYSMIAGSKTGKAAEADLIMGMGRNPNMAGGENLRTIHVSKNKLPGGFHGDHVVTILPQIAGFTA